MFKIRILHPNTITRLRLQPVMHGMAGLLFFFNAIGIYRSLQPNGFMTVLFLLMGLSSIVFPFVMRRFRNFSGANSLMRMLQVFVCFSACLYFLSHLQPVIGGLHVLVGIGLAYIGWTEYNMLQAAYIMLDIPGITLPKTFSRKVISWNQLNNVVLRNDLLTIDFKNNKLLQLEVLDNIPDFKAAEINAFCANRVEKITN
jgi:hypothetical protein